MFDLAEQLIEEGKFAEAKQKFLAEDMPAQAAFAAILDYKMDEAKEILQDAPYSLAKKWCVFLTQILSKEPVQAENPGFLTFRLFFETTIYYIIKFDLYDYLNQVFLNLAPLELAFPETRKFIGSTYLNLGDHENAIRVLKESIEKNSHDAETHFKLGEAYLAIKENDLAIASFEKTIELLPDHIASIEYIKQIKSAS